LVEKLDLAKKLTIDPLGNKLGSLIILIEVIQIYKKCFQENILEVKNCLFKTNLVHVTIDSRIRFGSNWSNDIRFGTSTQGC
jgi:hypothetical protein